MIITAAMSQSGRTTDVIVETDIGMSETEIWTERGIEIGVMMTEMEEIVVDVIQPLSMVSYYPRVRL
jgi:hypothetical protein